MRFISDEEVWQVVDRFERCQYSLEEFDHCFHLAVGLAYLSRATFADATEQMRTSLQRFSTHHGKQGYHETITRFWLMKLSELQGGELWKRANEAASKLDKTLIFEYYERDNLMNDEARQSWVSPPLKPFLSETGRNRF
jgi:hypothetical protein